MVYFGGFFAKLEFSRGFLYVYLIYISGRISAAAMVGDIIFFSLAGPVGDYTGAHTVIFAGFFYKNHSGKIYTPGSPSSGLKRSCFAGLSLYIIQCYGSKTFWCGSVSGSGSADPCLCLLDLDSDPDAGPDPAIFVSGLQDANKKLLLITF